MALRNNGFQNNVAGPPGLPHPTAGANLRVSIDFCQRLRVLTICAPMGAGCGGASGAGASPHMDNDQVLAVNEEAAAGEEAAAPQPPKRAVRTRRKAAPKVEAAEAGEAEAAPAEAPAADAAAEEKPRRAAAVRARRWSPPSRFRFLPMIPPPPLRQRRLTLHPQGRQQSQQKSSKSPSVAAPRAPKPPQKLPKPPGRRACRGPGCRRPGRRGRCRAGSRRRSGRRGPGN